MNLAILYQDLKFREREESHMEKELFWLDLTNTISKQSMSTQTQQKSQQTQPPPSIPETQQTQPPSSIPEPKQLQ